MASKVCAELLREGKIEMQNSLEESVRFKRHLKRALIFFGVVEFIVTVFVLFYVTQK